MKKTNSSILQKPLIGSVNLVAILTTIGFFLGVIILSLFGALESMNADRADREREDIQQLRNRLDAAQAELATHGFSVYKLGNQLLPQGVAEVVQNWGFVVGLPAYDSTDDETTIKGFNLTSGIYTVPLAGKYLVDSMILWLPSAGAGQRGGVIMTSQSPLFMPVDSKHYFGSGFTTNRVTGIFDLDVGDTVWVEAEHNAVGLQTVSTLSRFSIERIASA